MTVDFRRAGAAAESTGSALLDLVAALARNVCPECRAGKHANCNGDGGWDDEADRPVPCVCWQAGHQLD